VYVPCKLTPMGAGNGTDLDRSAPRGASRLRVPPRGGLGFRSAEPGEGEIATLDRQLPIPTAFLLLSTRLAGCGNNQLQLPRLAAAIRKLVRLVRHVVSH